MTRFIAATLNVRNQRLVREVIIADTAQIANSVAIIAIAQDANLVAIRPFPIPDGMTKIFDTMLRIAIDNVHDLH